MRAPIAVSAHCPPYPLGGRGHLDMPDPEFGQGVDQRVCHSGEGADTPSLAGAFNPEGIGLGWDRIAFPLHVAEVVCMRHGVVHERRGYELTGRIEMDVLHKGLPG